MNRQNHRQKSIVRWHIKVYRAVRHDEKSTTTIASSDDDLWSAKNNWEKQSAPHLSLYHIEKKRSSLLLWPKWTTSSDRRNKINTEMTAGVQRRMSGSRYLSFSSPFSHLILTFFFIYKYIFILAFIYICLNKSHEVLLSCNGDDENNINIYI